MEDALGLMRERVNLRLSYMIDESMTKQIRRTPDNVPIQIEVFYEGDSPAEAQKVAETITSLYIEDNFRLREARAAGTSKFLERELDRMSEILRQHEERIRQFKEEHKGSLPEEMANNRQILDQLDRQQRTIEGSIKQAEGRRVLLQTELNRLETLLAGLPQVEGEDGQPLTLDAVRLQLETLRSRYRDKHPDIIRLAALEARMAKEQEISNSGTVSKEHHSFAPQTEAQKVALVQKEGLLNQMELVDRELQALQDQERQTSTRIMEYLRRLETGPKIEQLYVDLRRGYDEARDRYQSLLEKKMRADLEIDLERTQKGEQFKVMESASLPLEPHRPRILLILFLGLAGGVHAGLGLAFLREYTDRTFWSSKQLEDTVQLPVLVSIPVITTDKGQRRKLLKMAGTVCALLAMCSAMCYALFILWKNNPTILSL
jgi:uncharacterized protein involved in exopolysaccharide biosynthesis